MTARTPPDDTKSADDAPRDEILQRRPELRGKSLEAMRRILRREARLSLGPEDRSNRTKRAFQDRQCPTLSARVVVDDSSSVQWMAALAAGSFLARRSRLSHSCTFNSETAKARR
jgi:hypothetical protein